MAGSGKQEAKWMVDNRHDFCNKYGEKPHDLLVSLIRIIRWLYGRDMTAWTDSVYYSDLDRMLTRMNYVRCDKSNTTESDGE